MKYRLKKDLGGLMKGSELHFVKGVFVQGDAAFDPLDVISDTDTFEEIEVNGELEDYSEFKTI